jgi:outer membrane murein-binding lipoprotein Lpp
MRRVVGGFLAVALLAGCGSNGVDEANRYVATVNHAQNRFAGTMDRLSGRISSSSSVRADAQVLRTFDTALGQVLGELRAAKPPAKVAPLHQRLVGEMDAYGTQIRREAGVLRHKDTTELVAAQQRLLSATDEVSRSINATIDRINRTLKG